MTLLVNKFNYTPLNRHEENNQRLYLCPDGSKVASVTTILSKTLPKEKLDALMNWRKSVGDKKATEITTDASNRGTRMHKYLEDHVNGLTLKTSVSNPYAQVSLDMAKIVIAEGMKNITEVWGSEVSLYYPGLYAGTTDGCGIHDGDEVIFDYKQTNKPKKSEWVDDYRMQLVAYALAHNKIHGTNIRKGVIMMCVKPKELSPGKYDVPIYQEFILTSNEFAYWEDKWWDRVEKYYRQTG